MSIKETLIESLKKNEKKPATNPNWQDSPSETKYLPCKPTDTAQISEALAALTRNRPAKNKAGAPC